MTTEGQRLFEDLARHNAVNTGLPPDSWLDLTDQQRANWIAAEQGKSEVMSAAEFDRAAACLFGDRWGKWARLAEWLGLSQTHVAFLHTGRTAVPAWVARKLRGAIGG